MQSARDRTTFELDGERFVRPDFSGRGLANVAATVLRLLAPSADGLSLPPLDAAVLPPALREGVQTVVLIVADGFGHLQMQREMGAGNAPNLRALIEQTAGANGGAEQTVAASEGDEQTAGAGDGAERAAAANGGVADSPITSVAYSPITSVFPSTTVAALGSLNSGVAPVEHGLLGYTLYLPEFDAVSEMIRWGPLNRRVSYADTEFGCAPEAFFWAETMYARLHDAGVDRAFAVNPSHFSGTALTRMLHQNAEYRGYIATSSVEPIVSRLVEDNAGPTYIYAYWPTVDTIAHLIGPRSPEHAAEVATFDAFFGRLLRSLPRRGDTLVLLTADHGHVVTQPEREVPFAEHPELLGMLSVLPAGERRAVYLHPRAGAMDEVVAYARERLRGSAAVMRRDEAVAAGLFGPGALSERAAARIGEVLLFPRSNLQFVTPVEMADGTPMRAPAFRGLHGGLTPDEALVPLLAVRM